MRFGLFMVFNILFSILAVLTIVQFLYIRRLKRRVLHGRIQASFFEHASAVLIVISKSHRILHWNDAAHNLFGYTPSEAVGRDMVDLIVPLQDRAHVDSILIKACENGNSTSKNFNLTKQKAELFCEWNNVFIDNCIICYAKDITSSKKILDDLSKRSTALESSGEAILYTNHKGLIEYANQTFYALCSCTQSTILNTHIGTYLFGSVQAMNSILPQFDADNTWKGTIHKKFTDEEKVFTLIIKAVYNKSRLVSYIATLHDITQLSEHVHSLTHQAHHDPLTGATNRSAMDERLEQAIDEAKITQSTIALFFIDLNDFKLVNDTHGHEVGDKLLSGVASNLRACLRNSDTIARFGGDEFVIIIKDIKNNEHIETVYKAIQAAIDEPIIIHSQLVITAKASIGIAQYPEDGDDAQSLLKAADEQMYRAKKQKKGSSL